MNKKISVVIPTYKRPALLKQCLEALALQDFNAYQFEVIVVTDGKDEETVMLIDEFNSRLAINDLHKINIHCKSLAEKKGPAAARNTGWQSAAGELIVFTDDDCLPASSWLSAFWKAYEKSDQKLIAFTGKIIVPHSSAPTDYERNTANLETAAFVTANCACTIQALECISGFDEDFKMAWREDSDLEFKLLENDISIQHVASAIITHPVRKAFWGVSLKEQKKGMFNALLYRKHPDMYQAKIKSGHVFNYYAMIIFLICSVVFFVLQKNVVGFLFLSAWVFLVSLFIAKRLRGASKSFSHITEMIVTSMCIPFVSVYWALYGSYKFKVLLL